MFKRLLFCIQLVVLIIISVTAQENNSTSFRSYFNDHLYVHGNYGVMLNNGLYTVTNIGLGFELGHRHHLGVEYIPILGHRTEWENLKAKHGIALTYQYRLLNWYLFTSIGKMNSHSYTDKASSDKYGHVYGDSDTYLTLGVKHCFRDVFCVGCQYTIGPFNRVYTSNDPKPAVRSVFSRYYSLRSLNLTFGFMLSEI
jgi:hypothetical protein